MGAAGRGRELLDLVALGIVADLAVQRRDTRDLLQRGLVALRTTRRLGLQVLMETAELDRHICPRNTSASSSGRGSTRRAGSPTPPCGRIADDSGSEPGTHHR